MATRRCLLSIGPLACLLLSFQPCQGQDCDEGDLRLEDPELAAKLQAHLDSVSAPFLGTALAVSIGGVGTWRGAHGFSRWPEQTPMLPDDRFRIASNTKTFVTAVLLQLDQEGVLEIDDPLEKWVPGYFDGKGIRLRNLIQHTSGIYNYTDVFWYNVIRTPQQLAEYASRQPLLFQPGSQWSYSNTNFVLLGMVIKSATGSDWEDEVRRRLLEPLGLSNTYVEGLEEPLAGGYVPGYEMQSPTRYVDVTAQVHYSIADAAGGMISSSRDLLRWLEALTSGEVLDAGRLEAMVTPFPASVGSFATPRLGEANRYGYGFGLQLEDIRLGPGLGHTGGIDAFTSVMMFFPEVGIGVVGWVNTRNFSYDVFDAFLPAAVIAYDHCASLGCPLRDVDRNGALDRCDIAADAGLDCNANGALDAGELAPGGIEWSSPPARHATGPGPARAIIADLDGDADLDFATANRTGKSVSVMLNAGDGILAAAVDQSLGVAADAITASDIDADGDLDLCTANTAARSVSILLNLGTASFAGAAMLDVGRRVYDIAGADLDGDGDADLVATDTPGKTVLVLASSGGAFPAPAATFSVALFPRALLVLDADTDGDTDIAVASPGAGNAAGGVELLTNAGGGDFVGGGFFEAGKGSVSMAGDDLDGDADTDLVVGNSSEYTVTVFRGDGAGGFAVIATLAAGLLSPAVLQTMDADGDGDLDLCVGQSDQVSIRRNDGNAGFPLFDAAQASFGSLVRNLIGGDLDGDGRQDLAGLIGGSEIAILLNATSRPASADCNVNGVPDACDIASGVAHDADGDGLLDECHARPRFHRGDPNSSGLTDLSDGIFIFSFLFLGGDPPSCQESADVNNDARVDISDGVAILNYLYLGDGEPVAPGPPSAACGHDLDAEGSAGDLGCAAYTGCGAGAP